MIYNCLRMLYREKVTQQFESFQLCLLFLIVWVILIVLLELSPKLQNNPYNHCLELKLCSSFNCKIHVLINLFLIVFCNMMIYWDCKIPILPLVLLPINHYHIWPIITHLSISLYWFVLVDCYFAIISLYIYICVCVYIYTYIHTYICMSSIQYVGIRTSPPGYFGISGTKCSKNQIRKTKKNQVFMHQNVLILPYCIHFLHHLLGCHSIDINSSLVFFFCSLHFSNLICQAKKSYSD